MLPLYVTMVDSDIKFLEIADRFLQKRSNTLVFSTVSTSAEILQQTNVFEPDIVVYNLEDTNPESLTTIKYLRERFPSINIVVISKIENEQFQKAVLNAGADDCVFKPGQNIEFLPAIWGLITMYQQRFGKRGIGIIPPQKAFI